MSKVGDSRPTFATLARYGDRGSAIPGSKFYRDYCCVCGEPMRVASREHIGRNICECRGKFVMRKFVHVPIADVDKRFEDSCKTRRRIMR